MEKKTECKRTNSILKVTDSVISSLEDILTKNQLGLTGEELEAWKAMTREQRQAYLKMNYPADYRQQIVDNK